MENWILKTPIFLSQSHCIFTRLLGEPTILHCWSTTPRLIHNRLHELWVDSPKSSNKVFNISWTEQQFTYFLRRCLGVKVSKCEIFDLLDSHAFYTIKSLWASDFETVKKNSKAFHFGYDFEVSRRKFWFSTCDCAHSACVKNTKWRLSASILKMMIFSNS